MLHESVQESGEVTRLLHRASSGESGALQQVLALLHGRLRHLAHRQLSGEAEGHTLETDGLVQRQGTSLALRRVLGDRRGEGWMLERLARVLRELGLPDEARHCAEQARVFAEDLGEPTLTAAALPLLAT